MTRDDTTEFLASRVHGVGRGTLATIATRVADVVATYGFYAIVARSLAPAEFGLFIFGLTLAQLAAAVARGGLDQALLASASSGAMNRFAAGRVAVLAIAVAAGAALGLAIWKRELPLYAIVLIAGVPILALAQFVIGALRASGSVVLAATAESVAQPVSALAFAAVAAARAHATIATFAIALIASWLAPLAFGAVVDWRGERLARTAAARVVTIGTSMFAVFLFQQAALSADVILLGLLAPAQEVARYAVAQKIAATFMVLHGAFTTASAPFIRRIAGDEGLLAGFRRLITRWSLVCGVPLFIVTAGVPALLLRLFGDVYARSSATPLTLLSIAGAAYLVSGPAGAILLCTGRDAILLRVTAAGSVALILAVAAFAPSGAVGTAGAVVAGTLFARGLLLMMLRRFAHLPLIDGSTLMIVAGAAAGVVTTRIVAPVAGEIGAVIVGCALALVFVAFVVVREGDLAFLRAELRRQP